MFSKLPPNQQCFLPKQIHNLAEIHRTSRHLEVPLKVFQHILLYTSAHPQVSDHDPASLQKLESSPLVPSLQACPPVHLVVVEGRRREVQEVEHQVLQEVRQVREEALREAHPVREGVRAEVHLKRGRSVVRVEGRPVPVTARSAVAQA